MLPAFSISNTTGYTRVVGRRSQEYLYPKCQTNIRNVAWHDEQQPNLNQILQIRSDQLKAPASSTYKLPHLVDGGYTKLLTASHILCSDAGAKCFLVSCTPALILHRIFPQTIVFFVHVPAPPVWFNMQKRHLAY